jgi:hypothetical protein
MSSNTDLLLLFPSCSAPLTIILLAELLFPIPTSFSSSRTPYPIYHSIQYSNRLCPLGHWDRGFKSHSKHGCLCAFFLFVLSCLGSSLAIGSTPVQGVLPTVYRIKKMKSGQGTKGYKDIEKGKRENAIFLLLRLFTSYRNYLKTLNT